MLKINLDIPGDPTSHEAYHCLNHSILKWSDERSFEPWQIWAIVYDLGIRLAGIQTKQVLEQSRRVWIIATDPRVNSFQEIDQHGEDSVGTWAINRQAKVGDLAMMYCVSPRSALVGVYRVLEDAHRDPFGGWNGIRAEIGEKLALPWIKIRELKSDSVMKDWRLVRSNFQGLLNHEVPQEYWDRIKQMVAAKDPAAGERLERLGAAATSIRQIKTSEDVWSEAEVEEKLIIPIMSQLGWTSGKTLVQQVPMQIKVGSGRPQKVRADFVGYKSDLTTDAIFVIEAKRKIRNKRELDSAQQQAESYAGHLRCPRYAVISPEGIWIYNLSFPGQSKPTIDIKLDPHDLGGAVQRLKSTLSFETCREYKQEIESRST
ncbi:EVE domain-containing protein [Thalassoglobus sp. JC818]|uniref:EVE domain-containing protein n=1 Tax=Thalassoglobus sp. JC818 TaxID=3232136 RepID=UPI003459BCB2